MYTRRILSAVLGLTVCLLTAQSAFAVTHIDASQGPRDGYSTLLVDAYVEQSDITNYNVRAWIRYASFSHNGGQVPVEGSTLVTRPAVAGAHGWYLSIGGAPPIPPQAVGNWTVLALLSLEYYRCSVQFGIPVCGVAFFCLQFGIGEPCEDTHTAYLQ